MVVPHISAESSVLLVIDVQDGIVGGLAIPEREKLLGNLKRAIGAAREAGIMVIYVMASYRKGYPEVSPRNAFLSRIKGAGRLKEGAADAKICHDILPRPEDIVVTKRKSSSFFGTDLEVILRARNIETLILTGVSSLGSVESTARAAFDLDYRLLVIGDGCADRDPVANEMAITHFLPRISTVCTTTDFIAAVSRSPGQSGQ